MNINLWFLTLAVLSTVQILFAQGPPMTVDAPIMLGGKTFVAQSLSELRTTNSGTFLSVPITIQYLPTSNSLIAVNIPYVNYNFIDGVIIYDDGEHDHTVTPDGIDLGRVPFPGENDGGKNFTNGSTLGDISIVGKYQLYRKDGMGKTFRIAAKTVQTLPTGERLALPRMSTGNYHGYFGFVTAYESLKFGVSNEIGYNWVPNYEHDEVVHKLGFGLPLLTPVYPVKQLNLFFEYNGYWMLEHGDYQLLYSQGLQYAKGKFIVEAAVQLPLIQDMPEEEKHKHSFFFGGRYVF